MSSPKKRKVNAKGRNEGAKHVRLYEAMLSTAAYRSLKPPARALLVELNRLYNGSNNGSLFCSQRHAAKALNYSSRASVKAAFDQLIDRGFVKENQKGGFDWKNGHATTFILTQHGFNDAQATQDFRKWRPSDQKTSGHHSSSNR
ncbi:hypothetical protein [Sphingomicrobium arenosum]|uniref:hypothetical protein n=1 Tax=Sphingomicrobium arenosum TaxID=2233861 RepID=UPI002240AD28|nr:hypothetical protein [Sphingomicrobium arenosum]